MLLLRASYSPGIEYSSDCNIVGGWKNSSLRAFLNGKYLNMSFDDYIKEHILTTQLVNSSDITDITKDKIFILSEQEVSQYFPFASDRAGCIANTTMRNVENGIYTVIYENSFETVKYVDGEAISVKYSNYERGYWRVNVSESSKNRSIVEVLNGKYYPAMWIDVSSIE